MGSLKRFNLRKLIKSYNISYLFETGTWKGDSIAYALHFRLKRIFSSEIMPEIADEAKLRFKNYKNVEIITDNSIDALLSKIDSIKGNCIFWLDAHFPGAEEGIKGYNDTKEDDLKFPLRRELEVVYNRYPKYKDIILIDDLRIYEDGPFESGNMPSNIHKPETRNLNFLNEMFSNSHLVEKSYKNEGYIIILPKDSSFDKNDVFTKRTFFYYIKRVFNKY